jgi:hypothetical protein
MKIAPLIDFASRFDFADGQNRSMLQKPIATYRLFPSRTDLVNQVKAQRADGNTSLFLKIQFTSG